MVIGTGIIVIKVIVMAILNHRNMKITMIEIMIAIILAIL